MLADSHLHLFSRGFRGRYGWGPLGLSGEVEAYERLRAEHGIVAGLVVGYEADDIDPGNNRYIRGLAQSRPWMTTLAYVETATAGPDTIASLLDHGHAGITLYLRTAEQADAVCSWSREAWERLHRRRAIVSFNAPPASILRLAPVIEAHGGCRFLFSHLGLPGRQPRVPGKDQAVALLQPLLRMARLAHVHVKLSGLYAVSDPAHGYPHLAAAPFIELLLEHFGPARCLWGSDFSPSLDFVSFAQAVDLPGLDLLSADERTAVMGGSLLKLLEEHT